ncbi:hypothetical protein DV735_g1919, partial [Chaetothyriales sp. CBS 134920]
MGKKNHVVAIEAVGESNDQEDGSSDHWLPFAQTASNLEQLQGLCQSEEQLSKAGYVRQQLSTEQLKAKLRCTRCTARINYRPHRSGRGRDSGSRKAREGRGQGGDATPELEQPGTEEKDETAGKEKEEEQPKMICYYHPRPFFGQFSFWQFHQTPDSTTGNTKAASLGKMNHRLAVAIDCEMGTSTTGEPALIRLSAIDVFSKETLVDKIVLPEVKMLHLNTRFSGVSWQDIRRAEASGNYLRGTEAARKALFRLIGPDTIVVVHGGTADFNVLRWIHPRVIDTFLLHQQQRKAAQEAADAAQLASDMVEAELFNMTVLEVQQKREAQAEAEKLASAERLGEASLEKPAGKREPGSLSLKALVKEHAGINIQMGNGHDSVEDAFGCRELAIRFLLNDKRGQESIRVIMPITHAPSGRKSFLTTANPFEKKFGYHRAVRRGPFIYVSGTTAINPESGQLEARGDAYNQALSAMSRSLEAVEKLGGKSSDVVRVRMFVSNFDDTGAVGEAFRACFASSGQNGEAGELVWEPFVARDGSA